MKLKHLLLLPVVAFGLQACVNLNLKTTLPPQTYYSLDKEIITPSCTGVLDNIKLETTVLSPYDTKDLLVVNSEGEVTSIDSIKWVDLPQNMVRNLVVKLALNNCIHVSTQASYSEKLDTLRLYVNDMHLVVANADELSTNPSLEKEYSSRIFLSYDLLSPNGVRLKSGVVLTTSKDKNPVYALQDAIKSAASKVIGQVKAYNDGLKEIKNPSDDNTKPSQRKGV
ncbi:hypothetical protein BKH43_02550 [Helicobacter sp. 13S00401-1]|uniref:hypothetical protein n=1 Tax=Helicobacter sp. 13S00401-1 TaxID=1905758 RepID=UPI000BA6D579|nr:hypothetical protein [Helicobacter sp. 13S00401-1]PAF51105.1 hypothetical protein BKH43_02550 [Helicobacter sp. 13S00401-1]